MSTHPITRAVEKYNRTIEQAEKERTRAFQEVAKEGVPQTEIIEKSGYSRETVRRILKPEIVEAQKARRRKS
ncbi:hypothetical protein ACOQFV_08950 [Nocardiopsis changdeensis]|uniref:Uncharacterized protein n=1 Tax=Nocardiopsis changdeensis TaxID=2831969 RepID=A0ABX8BDK2_9ACTN|nr:MULTISPECIES: hypothetical protein [Nocardiopsis]QUX20329.1 hypothetical protein KGD84_17530 [Nocardiopsis changdeensis]QYX36259.1 hypothetical protein K1J57_26985 [Nocardiopsis sp. MT53]